jgi:class 3 adenylate cyclase/tetratricopeptide (TPR) repeat protein
MARLGGGIYHRDVVGGSGAGAGRSTAIVLFTDLVGSTALRSRLGEEAAEEVRRKHDRLVTVAIDANRGQLVKNLGDGVMATFSGASDAVAAAVDIQQALDRFNRSDRSAASLEVRVGLSAGDVAVEEGDCFGTPVIEAARLCTAARGGQVLATEVVRLLAGSAGGHQFTPVGTLELKGLPAPVSACEVVWEPLPAAPLPLPSLLVEAGRIFVGRDEELGHLTQLWKEAAAGERRVALLAGEPGIGKTRLATELARTVHNENGVVLAGRCDEDLGVPYQPFVEALRHYATGVSEPRLGRYSGELTRLVPELADALPGLSEPLRSDPETERYRLFDAVAAWLADVSAETPVVLVLDDLHWAAKPTLLLLRHVARFAEPLRLLVVVTYRDSEVGRGHPLSELLADLRRHGGVERLSLTGLDQAAVGAFIEAAAGHTLPEEDDATFIRAVWEETEGNPFFVAEVIRHLSESGAIEQRDGRWVTTGPVEELGIPEGVRDVVGRRLSRLGEETNRTLAVASVLGLEFEPAVLGAAGGFAEDELFSALEEATAARLLAEVSGTRFRFAHALVRATLYDELSAPRRVGLHRRVAEAIEALHASDLDDHLPALAYHWARASAPAARTDRAVEYATRAGDRALAQLAHDEASAYYAQALELLEASSDPPDAARRVELLIALGEAERRAGDPTFRETLLEAARLAQLRGDAGALARAALANNRGVLFSTAGAVDAERVMVLEAALEAGSDDRTRARLLANLALELLFAGDSERCVTLSDTGLTLARRLGDPDTLAHVLVSRYYATAGPDSLGERLANTEELLALVERLPDPVTKARAWWLRCRAALESGAVEEAYRCLDEAERLSTELAQPGLRWITAWARVSAPLLAGRLDEAEQLANAALALGRAAGERDASVFFAVQQFAIRFEQGRLGELETSLAGQAASLPGLPMLQLMLALLYVELDRDQEARSTLARFSGGFPGLARDILAMRSLTLGASVAAHLGDSGVAEMLSNLLTPYADQLVVMVGTVNGSVTHYLGMLATTLGRFDEAQARFATAAATHERIEAAPWLARTRLEWARMLLSRHQPGDAERAGELLGQVMATARDLGLGNVERRAVGLLT